MATVINGSGDSTFNGNIIQLDSSPEYHFATDSATHYNWRIAAQEQVDGGFEIASGTQTAGSNASSDTYTNRLVIDSAGRVTMPYQPAFYAKGGAQESYGIGNDQEMVFGSVSTNIGNYYAPSSGRFTAPVSGVYFFTTSVRVDGASTEYFRVRIRRNNATQYETPHSIYDLGQVWDPRYFSMTVSGVIYLVAGDYASVSVSSDADTSWQFYGTESSFSGYLIG